ncbi:Protein of uncharacterised function (DUF2848) [Serratia entomophila]|jgi:hypothetical protein|uniref:DUF2848 domain-containing protein n=1 Tax=Serratia entomophila TaxID=42906 RepID=UPI001F23CA1D|nr:DUF2848 domain-containing protein [Serratia entomophila]UIW17614.1 DUF2848 domain-containing protein [Serratia entomophila]CAI0705171.1 Protein of uncharacterised function (DUF2848) [Serratia entomophila]CAI0781177.1 Protein of uncharacterised function (DUF2848) [Serratia entomophila]CAI0967310.1 Protein of uncharacterised function (DUF2848) [Serratia entomophila]CAI0967693.1 Protein of uncharacterised function (DUF2848) [Serratia entomophila]
MRLTFTLPESRGAAALNVEIDQLVIAGWTGRDREAILHHIRELAELGVPQPSAIPLFYRVAANQLSQNDCIEVIGSATSGEAEPFIFSQGGELFVSLASDHTDRQLEAHSVALSKQICVKPVARAAWPLREVLDHWDALILRSWIKEDGEFRLYQQGTLASLRTPGDLLERYLSGLQLPECGLALPQAPDGLAMTCGTLAAIGGIRPALEFRMELADDVLGRTISHSYRSIELPVVA